MRATRQIGFTLMEVMISIVIITIAFFAMLVTQGTALDGYSATRDISAASDVARTVIETMQIEGAGWNTGGFATLTVPPFVGGSTPFDQASLLNQIDNGGWGWVSLNAVPRDARLASGVGVPGRFCVFARGGFVEMDITPQNSLDAGGALIGSPMWSAQIAVVYPGPNGNLLDCAAVAVVDLDPQMPTTLESKGLRASYFGTMIVRREW